MYKLLLLVDKEVDPTIYNFKDISGKSDKELFTYLTNDFHPQWNCDKILKDFTKACKQADIKVIAHCSIHKEEIAKEYR